MRRLLLLPFLVLPLACSPPVEVQGSCTYAARVNGVDYGLETYLPKSEATAGAVFARTLRARGCDDVIEYVGGQPSASRTWVDGDSSFPAGTALYVYEGYPPSELLLVEWREGEWMVLRRLLNQP